MNLKEATEYVGLGITKFRELVKEGRMPQPRVVGARVLLWDVFELDDAYDRLPRHEDHFSPPAIENGGWDRMSP